LPPSTGNITPVTMDAAAEARNDTGLTISGGSAQAAEGMPESERAASVL
jgi:hypothetical protein